MQHKLFAFLALAFLSALNLPLSTALAQNAVVTYQGLVQSGGELFTGAGQFKFALLATTNTSAKATATATVSSGAITAINVTFGGSGYVTPPAVTISGILGSGASATANLSGGAVVSVTVNNGGSGYILGATVTIAVPPPTLAYHTHWSNDGTSVSGSEPTAAVALPVASGLFTAPLGDASVANMTAFDAGLFAQPNLLLRLWFDDGTNGFAVLQPPQPLSAAPYALVAGSAASLSGTYGGAVSFNNGANNFTGSGAGLVNVNAGTLGGLNSSNFWRTTGNAATTTGAHFLGTTDNQPLEIKVNGQRVFRFENNNLATYAPNVIGGSHYNFVAVGVVGATIAGGGGTNFNSSGRSNSIAGDFGTIGGGQGNRIEEDTPNSTIGGGIGNRIRLDSSHNTIGGGQDNFIGENTRYCTIAGGQFNHAGGKTGRNGVTVGGGTGNYGFGSHCTIAGGWGNTIESNPDDLTTDAFVSVISGGRDNLIDEESYASVIGGGIGNLISTNGDYSVISGGESNNIVANSSYSFIAGGRLNSATDYAFAAGRRAKAIHIGAFVWADSQNADFASTTANQFCIRASGGVRLSDNTPDLSFGSTARQMVNLYSDTYGIGVQSSTMYFRSNSRFSWFDGGTHSDSQNNPGTGGTVLMTLTSGGLTVNGTFVSASDRNAKENIVAVDPRAVLEKVAALPIARWNYKHDQETPHLGPMAQDFYAAFGVGPDDKHITTVDADGVALAAIQGLNQKVEVGNRRSEGRIEKLESENADLRQELTEIRRLLVKLSAKGN